MIYATELLHKAGNLITGSRKETHGDFVENHKNIARLWSAYLEIKISPIQVLTMMALLKIARTKTGKYAPDNNIDAIGYLALDGQLRSKLEQENDE